MRYTLELPEYLHAILSDIAEKEGISMSELMRKSLMTYCILHKEISNGATVCITKGEKIEKELVFGWTVLQ